MSPWSLLSQKSIKKAMNEIKTTNPLNILSLGLGVQSTALYFMSSLGQLPRFDAAIFADLGREKAETYRYLEYLQQWNEENNGIPIYVIKKKNLYTDLLKQINSTANRFAAIPAYTKNEDDTVGMLKRQCTSEYKIKQVDALVRYEIYKSEKFKRLPLTNIWKGISLEENDRMNIPQEAWKIHVYPFCGWETYKPGKARQIETVKMSRNAIIAWYENHQLPVPVKSSCVFCPFQSELSWYLMKTNEPDDFEAACLVDEKMRDSSKKGVKQPIYLHESCIPLREVKFTANAPDLWSGDCSGTCHN